MACGSQQMFAISSCSGDGRWISARNADARERSSRGQLHRDREAPLEFVLEQDLRATRLDLAALRPFVASADAPGLAGELPHEGFYDEGVIYNVASEGRAGRALRR